MDITPENLTEPIQNFISNLLLFLPNIVAALILFIIGLIIAGFASRWVKRLLTRRKFDNELTLLLGQITRWGIIILALVLALEQVNFDLTAFLTGLGILGFTVGFALQDVSKNFIAGLLLLLEQPFEIGDTVEVAGFTGTVLDIELRTTKIMTLDGRHVLIPNGDVFTSPITNFSRSDRRRIELKVGVAYDTDLELATSTALGAVKQLEGVLAEPDPMVIFDTFGGSSIDFTLYYWVDNITLNPLTGRDAAVKKISAAFVEKGIEIPFPIQTVIRQDITKAT